MTRYLHQQADSIKLFLSTVLCAFLTGSAVYAGTVTIAVTPGTLDAVDTIARSFETAHVGDNVQIVVASSAELKGAVKSLPLHIIVSDDLSLIEWMEARNFASRPAGKPAISVPLAVVASPSDTVAFNSTGDLINRMKQQDAVLTISDPLKTDCGRRAQILLNTLGISAEPSARLVHSRHTEEVVSLVRNGKAHFGLVFAPEAMSAKGISVHGLSASTVASPIHSFAVKQGQQSHAVAQRFLAFANSSEGRNAMKTRGYEPLMN
ncbi:MAG: substrate-binding domain-containing protein [Nitrospira sp.]|nr:substrate-binding domain-containing protein [Nitrospira sp.]